jgi:hypothetical protein
MGMNMDAPDTTNHTERWVADRLRALDPPDTWEPATAVALALFRERAAAAAAAAPRQRLWNFRWPRFGTRAWVAAANAVGVVLILLLIPATRTAAQRLWDVFFAERVEFVRLDLDKLPRSLTEQHIRIVGANKEVNGIQEAASYVGFTPRLPDGSLAPPAGGDPRFQVAGAISLEWQVKAFELEAAARHARLFDVHFPQAWDGARIAVHSSPMVIVDYLNFQLIQVMPLAITTPPDFPLGDLFERILRIGGMTQDEARTYSARMNEAPFAMFAVAPDEQVRLREVRLRAGTGTLAHDLDEHGNLQRTTLVWSTPDRVYAISAALSDDEVIGIANAIPIP